MSSVIFHGHQHETAMIYRREGLDLFKPKAAYMGGFALVRVTDRLRWMWCLPRPAKGHGRGHGSRNAFSKRF